MIREGFIDLIIEPSS